MNPSGVIFIAVMCFVIVGVGFPIIGMLIQEATGFSSAKSLLISTGICVAAIVIIAVCAIDITSAK